MRYSIICFVNICDLTSELLTLALILVSRLLLISNSVYVAHQSDKLALAIIYLYLLMYLYLCVFRISVYICMCCYCC